MILDRQPILPPRWASAGSVPRAPRRRRPGLGSHPLAAGLVAAALAVIGLRAVVVPQEALGEPRPAPAGIVDAARHPGPAIPVHIVDLPDPCPLDWRAGHAEVRSLIACEANLWRVPGGPRQAFAVAHCESRFEPEAFNPTGCGGSGCGGLYQQSLRYWRQRSASYGYAGSPPTNPRANIVVSMRMAAERGTWERDWPVCGR